MEVNFFEFEELVRPLIKYLAENHNPHTSIIITNTSAEIVEGKLCFHTEDYLEKPIQNFVKCNGCPDEDICTDEKKAVHVFRKEECIFQYCPTPEICKENGCQCKK